MDMRLNIPTELSIACSKCLQYSQCMPTGLNEYETLRMDSLVTQRVRIKKGNDLYRNNFSEKSMYIVRAGCFKTVISHHDGRDQVVGFHMSGESLGLGVEQSNGANSKISALEDSVVCVIPFVKVEELANSTNDLHSHIRHLFRVEIKRENSVMLFLGSMNSEERVATFLLNLSLSHEARGFSGSNINLKMSRYDIASYLGIKHETVSRTLSKFIKGNLINLNLRLLKIINFKALHSIANDGILIE